MTTDSGFPVLGRDLQLLFVIFPILNICVIVDLRATGLSSTAMVDSLENCRTGVVLPEPITDFC